MVQLAFQITNGIIIHVSGSVKSIIHGKKGYILNPSTCIRENGKYLKIIVDTSVIVCDENINVIESV